eukprot:Rmarinus@m.11379
MKDKPPEWDPSSWLSGFVKRHGDKIFRETRQVRERARHQPIILKDVEDFIDKFELVRSYFREGLGPLPCQVLNCEETSVELKNVLPNGEVLFHADDGYRGNVEPDQKRGFTYLPIVSADGKVLLSVYCFPESWAKTRMIPLPNNVRTSRNNLIRLYVTSETGFLVSETWATIMDSIFGTYKKNVKKAVMEQFMPTQFLGDKVVGLE